MGVVVVVVEVVKSANALHHCNQVADRLVPLAVPNADIDPSSQFTRTLYVAALEDRF